MEIEVVLFSNIVAAVLALTALLASKRGAGSNSRVSGIINTLVIVLLVMICLEIFNFWSNGKTFGWVLPVKYITTPLHNYFTVLYPGLCAVFAYEYSFVREKNSRVRYLLVVPSFIWVVVLFVNFWKGFVFTIDADVVYHRGDLVYLTFVMPFVYYVVGVIITFLGYYGNGNFLRFPVWTLAFPALGGVAFQAVTPGVSTIHLGVAIGLCGVCVSIQKEPMFIDSLTGLYNRSYFFYVFSKTKKMRKQGAVGVIMLDVNDLKKINDEFGHQQGDIALREAAAILEESIVKGAALIRFAGDEFIFLIRLSDTDKVNEALNEILDRVSKNTEKFNNRKNAKYQISFAVGSSVKKEDESPDELLARIDKILYRDKGDLKSKSVSVRRRA